MTVIGIAAQKGGVLKTETAKWLAYYYATSAHRTPLLIDMDPQGDLTRRVEAEPDLNRRKWTGSLLAGKASMNSASVVGFVGGARVYIVPASEELADTAAALQARSPNHLFLSKALRNCPYNCVIVDCAPSTSVLTINALAAADHVIIPVTPTPDAIKGASAIIELIERLADYGVSRASVAGLIATAVEDTVPHRAGMDGIADLAKAYGIALLGRIPKHTGQQQQAFNQDEYGLIWREVADIFPGGRHEAR